ncbi:MAG: Holliday junction resolvase RuvX [Brevinematales bacterium]|nr:Holliday junction resolvase RuvX [Brevinematales bacterium]
MRLLGLDIGTKNIGVAFCDTSVGIVFPRTPIKFLNQDYVINQLKDIIRKDRIEKIIVGLPLNFNSTKSGIQEYIERFASTLNESLGVEVELFDERFTTMIAQNLGVKNIDSVSAKIILEDYIKFKFSNS